MPATWSEGRIAFWVTWSWQLHVHIELMDGLTGNSSCRNPSSMPETFKSTKLPQVSNQSQRPHLRTEYCLPCLWPARLKVLRFWGQLAGQENSAAPCCHTICAHTQKSPVIQFFVGAIHELFMAVVLNSFHLITNCACRTNASQKTYATSKSSYMLTISLQDP